MTSDRLRLKTDVDPSYAVAALRELRDAAANTVPGVADRSARSLREAYLRWVERAQEQLWTLTADGPTTTFMETPGHWHIRELVAGQPNAQLALDARAEPLISSELTRHAGQLKAMCDDLERRIHRAEVGRGHAIVLDTNVLLHFMRPDQISWSSIVDAPAARLVIPLRVVEELDSKKYLGESKAASRAREVLPWLERSIGPAGEPQALKPNGSDTIEVTIDPGPRDRPIDADREILDACHELRQFGSSAVTFVSGDTGALLRARSEAIEATKVSDKYKRDRHSEKAVEPNPDPAK